MKYIISEIQFRLLEQDEKALSPVELILFKKLNQEKAKGKLKTKEFLLSPFEIHPKIQTNNFWANFKEDE